MNYYQHNIGDFANDTKLMTFEQKGIYVDMLDRYASTGMPLGSQWVATLKRVAGEEAVDTVLSLCFEERDGFYHHERMDKLLADYEKMAEKNRANGRKRATKSLKTPVNAEEEQIGSQSVASGNPVGSLTINHKPKIDSRAFRPESAADESAQIPPSPDPFVSEVLEEMQALEEERPVIPSKPRRAVTHKFAMEALPDDWREFCEQVRPDLNPQTTFASFRAYFLTGNGSDKLRSDKGWNQSWQTWVKKEKAAAQAPARRIQSQEVEISSDYF